MPGPKDPPIAATVPPLIVMFPTLPWLPEPIPPPQIPPYVLISPSMMVIFPAIPPLPPPIPAESFPSLASTNNEPTYSPPLRIKFAPFESCRPA